MNIIMSRALPHQYPHRLPPTQQAVGAMSSSSSSSSRNQSSKPTTPTSPLDFTDRIPVNELRLSSRSLGSGSFGTVFKGSWRGRIVAVKQFKTREEIDSFLVEVKQLSCVKHTNIVTLYGASTLADTAFLIMEYAEGGSLNHLLHECRQQVYDLTHACSWAMQTARGVAYLHGLKPKPIMHRDLKPANLLLFSRGKVLKICDFGTACAVKTQMTNNTGSALYMAPEVFATSSYLESGDVFSWSIIFWEILTRTQPYSRQSNPYQILWGVNEGARPTTIEGCPKLIWDLITKSWESNPRKRPTMQQVAEEMELIFSLSQGSGGATTSKSRRPSTSTSTSNESQQQNLTNRPSLPIIFSQMQIEGQHVSGQSSAEIRYQNLQQQHQLQQHHHLHQHHHHQFQEHQFHQIEQQHYLQQQQSIHSQTLARNHLKALLHHIENLTERYEQLKQELQRDKKNSAGESFKEFEELKRVISSMKKRARECAGGNQLLSSSSAGSTPSSPHRPPIHQQQHPNDNQNCKERGR